jgi:hypothetical protein
MAKYIDKSKLKKDIEEILFDLGKNIDIIKIDKDNIILDVPYGVYVNKVIIAVESHYPDEKYVK